MFNITTITRVFSPMGGILPISNRRSSCFFGASADVFPLFLLKEMEKIEDPCARKLISRIEMLPVELSVSNNRIMSSCVKPMVQDTPNPLVLLHGFDSSCLEWRYTLPLLEQAGLEAWAIDILGWGFNNLENLPPCNVHSKRDHLYQVYRSCNIYIYIYGWGYCHTLPPQMTKLPSHPTHTHTHLSFLTDPNPGELTPLRRNHTHTLAIADLKPTPSHIAVRNPSHRRSKPTPPHRHSKPSPSPVRNLSGILAPLPPPSPSTTVALGFIRSGLKPSPPTTYFWFDFEFWKSYIRRPMMLVGPSLGAAVAIDFATKYPEAVDKLILINASVYAEGTGNLSKLPKSAAYAGVSLLKSPPLRFYATNLTFSALPLSTCLDWTRINRLHCLLPWWEDATVDFMISGGYNVSDQINQVLKKTLIIWGENDRIIDGKLQVRLHCELLNAKLRQIPNCGHIPHVEKPEAVANLISEFVQRKLQSHIHHFPSRQKRR